MTKEHKRDVGRDLRAEWERGLQAERHTAVALEHLAALFMRWRAGEPVPELTVWQRVYVESRIYHERWMRDPNHDRDWDEAGHRDPGRLWWEETPGEYLGGPATLSDDSAKMEARSYIATGDIPEAARSHRHVHTDVFVLAMRIEKKLGGWEAVQRLRTLVTQREAGRPSKAQAAAREDVRRAAWSVGVPAEYEHYRTTALALVMDCTLDAAQALLQTDPTGVSPKSPSARPYIRADEEEPDKPPEWLKLAVLADLRRAGLMHGYQAE
jgi:hypothetical protein